MYPGLADYPQFVLYTVRPSARPGKTDKIPVNPQTGWLTDHGDPAARLTLEQALAAQGSYGIGFVFTEQDPFFFLDIDGAYTAPTVEGQPGRWSDLATDLCSRLQGCFIEVSHSGTGLHIIGTTPPLGEHGTRNPLLGLELYTRNRFVALTGTGAQGTAHHVADLSHVRSLPGWSAGLAAGAHDEEWTTGPCPEWSGPESDAELIDRMLASRPSAGAVMGGKATLQQLWTADMDALSRVWPDPRGFDHSAADFALCAHLAFWTGKDCERMDRLFRLSGLMRDKWADRQDYREKRAILPAVNLCREVYSGGSKPAVVEPPPEVIAPADPTTGLRTGMQLMSVPNQIPHFTGCVYVREDHAVFIPDGSLLKPEQFRTAYGGYTFCLDMQNDKTTKSAWEVFTESQGYTFPKAHASCFRPELPPGAMFEEEGRTLVNTYVPVVTPQQPGDPSLFLNHVARLLPDTRDQQILLSYMAALVQYPGKKFFWAPILQGVQGNGKTLFINALTYAVGLRYTHYPNPDDISNKFNSWILNKLFIGVEEVYVAEKQDLVNTLKRLVANKRVDIQGKGTNQSTGDNRANFFMCTNHKDALRVKEDDRRYAIFFTAQQHKSDLERDGMTGDYFPVLYTWLDNGGYAVVNWYLRSYAIPDELNPTTMCHRAPATTSTTEALAVSMGGIEQEVLEAIEEGRPGFAGGWISSLAFDRLLDQRHSGGRVPRSRRREVLQSIGYDWHPALPDGRVNNSFMDCGTVGKPRLFIRRGHLACGLTRAADVVRYYTEAQQGAVTVADMVMGTAAQGVAG